MLPANVVWKRDPVGWIHRFLGIALTEDQVALAEAVRDHRRVIGQSAHACGKTLADAAIALWFLYNHFDSEVILTASSMWQARARIWTEVERLWRGARVRLDGTLTATQLMPNPVKYPRWKMSAVATDNPSNIQGGHAPHVLIVVDEGQAVRREIFEACESMLSGGHSKMLVTLNPLFAGGAAYERTRKRDQWKVVKLSALNHPNVRASKELIPGAIARDWVEEMRRAHGEDSTLYVSRVLGEYPKVSESNLISMADLEACADIKQPMVGDGTHIGCDIARYGSDSSWAVVTKDGRMVAESTWQNMDLMASVGKLRELMDEYEVPAEHVSIDVGGVGAGVVDSLIEQGFQVNPVDFGASPSHDWDDTPCGRRVGIAGHNFLNRKAELYWLLRLLLKAGLFSIPSRFERVWSDLLSTQYEIRSDGRFKIEAKELQRQRMGRSPDAGDALVISLARDLTNAGPMVTFLRW